MAIESMVIVRQNRDVLETGQMEKTHCDTTFLKCQCNHGNDISIWKGKLSPIVHELNTLFSIRIYTI